MSNNLTKIREMVSSIKKSLGSLTVNPDALDEIDSVASQRVMLREKLATLEAVETVVREQLVAEEIKQKGKNRRAALVELAAQSEKLVTEHAELTDQASSLINDLVSVLIKRECVFTQKSTGLDASVYRELFTAEEYKDLIYEMNRSTLGLYQGEFSAAFYKAINDQASDDSMKRIKEELRSLVATPQSHHVPFKGATTLLIKMAKSLQFKSAPEPEKAKPVEAVEPKTGNHYEVDLRQPGHVKQL